MEIPPEVSVIIPHLNQNDALEKCIFSLQEQSYPLKNIEIIVADNGSQHLPQLESKVFKQIRVISEKTPGPGPARNCAVKASKSNFLFFIDADCIAAPNWIANGIALLCLDETLLAGGDVKICKNDIFRIGFIEAYENIFAFQQKSYIENKGFSVTCNMAVSRENFDLIGPFPGINVAEDRVWGARAREAGFSFTFCPEMIIYHPARESFQELFDKWARHSRHDFAELDKNSYPLLYWANRSLLVLGSIPVHSIIVIFSKRLNGFVPKLKAITALAIIRLYRVGFMWRMIFSKKFRNQDMSWNR